MSSNWWANKLGQPQRPADLPPMPPSQQPMTTYTPPARPQRLPESVAAASQCPGCRGGNYVKIGEQVTINGSVPTFRCYDCGYPLVQSGSGLGGASSAPREGGVTPAKQVETGGWNPTAIIGKLE